MAIILLIEDNLSDANMLKRVLIPHGYLVKHAGTAIDGLRMAKELRPDLILLDLDLPDLDGRIVASRLKNNLDYTHIPIVAVTAHYGYYQEQLARSYGCDGYIPKPIETRNFPNQIKQYLK